MVYRCRLRSGHQPCNSFITDCWLVLACANTAVAACSAAGCTAAQMATTDKAQWAALLARSLPAGTGAVAVDTSTSPTTYTITVRWTEPNVGAQTYVLGFQ